MEQMDSKKTVFRRFADVSRCVYALRDPSAADIAAELAANTALPEKRMATGELLACSLHRLGEYLFLYYECRGCDLTPEQLFPSCGGRFRPMMEVYHCNLPESEQVWRTDHKSRPQGRMIFLRPEMVGSYIFYHYQLQEEQPGADEKHFQISICENLLFMYTETPGEHVKPGYPRKLMTNNTPENWPALMHEHFQPWPDGEDEWRDTVTVLSLT